MLSAEVTNINMKDASSASSKRQRTAWWAFLMLLLVLAGTFAVYARVIPGEFQFDDEAHITDRLDAGRQLQRMATGYPSLLISSKRPITMLSFALNHSVGGLAVEGYHLVNIALHLLTVVVVFLFVRRLLLLPALREPFAPASFWLPLLAAAIFALHPLQTMAVSYVVQRAEVIASLFYLLALLAFLRAFASKGWQAISWYLAGFGSFFIGWGGKEIVVTIFLSLILLVLFLGNRQLMRKALALAAPLLLVGSWMGWRLVQSFKGRGDAGFNIAGVGQPEYLYTQFSVLWTYMRLIFWPAGQTVDYDYPLLRDFWSLPVAGSLLLWVLVLTVCLLALRYQGEWRGHFRLAAIGPLWFIVLLAPTSSLVPLVDIIFEHRVYLALLGPVLSCLAAADALRIVLGRRFAHRAAKTAAVLIACAVLVALGSATWQRNAVWESKMALWTDAARKAPGKSRIQNNLGNCYYLKGELLPALIHYLAAIRLNPNNREPYYNASILYRRVGKSVEADDYLVKFQRLGGIVPP